MRMRMRNQAARVSMVEAELWVGWVGGWVGQKSPRSGAGWQSNGKTLVNTHTEPLPPPGWLARPPSCPLVCSCCCRA